MIESIRGKIYDFLRKSEKYTDTDMLYLVKGGGWLSISQGLTTITGFLLLILFTNLLPKETYGTYRYILSFVSILSIFSLKGVSTSIIQAISRGYEGDISTAFKTKLKYGLLVTLAGFLIGGYYYLNDNVELAISFWILGVLSPLMNAMYLYRAILNGLKLFKTTAIYEVISQIISLIVLGVTVYLTDNIVVIITLYFSNYVLMRGFFFWYTFERIKFNEKKDSSTITYGKHLSLLKAIEGIAGQIDKVLVFHYLGAAPLALYALAVTPVNQIRSFVNNIRPLALPKFSISNISELKKTLPKKIFKFELILLPIVVIYIFAAPFIFKYVFPDYIEAVMFSQVLAIMIIFVPRTLLTVALTAQKRTKELYIIKIVTPIFRIAILFVFVINFGIWGVVWGTLITAIFKYILYFGLFISIKPLPGETN
jgi:O-antigen/teichoic acid export membrane protein